MEEERFVRNGDFTPEQWAEINTNLRMRSRRRIVIDEEAAAAEPLPDLQNIVDGLKFQLDVMKILEKDFSYAVCEAQRIHEMLVKKLRGDA